MAGAPVSAETRRHKRISRPRAFALPPLLLVAGGCGLAGSADPGPGPAPEPVVLLAPHWDQVCRPERGTMVPRLEEVLAPAGRLELEGGPELKGEAFDGPEAVGPGADARAEPYAPHPPHDAAAVAPGGPPFVEVGVRYDASGILRTAHLHDHNVADSLAEETAAQVAGSLRPRLRLLEPVAFRVRLAWESHLRVALLPALSCAPHITHEDDLPPALPPGVRLRNGRLFRGGEPHGSEVAVEARISRTGRLESVEFLGGNATLQGRAREVLRTLEFDPALRNGEPVAGTLDLVVGFDG